MKTLYLYIGTPKTASTSVQRFLKQNRDIFPRYNYRFPLMPFSYQNVSVARNAHFLIYHEGDLISEEGSSEKKADRSELLKKGFDVVHEAFQTYDNVILADEGLWYAIGHDSKNFTQILPEDARENAYTVKIIVYLRRQDQLLYSIWNQKVKNCESTESLKAFMERILSTRPYITEYDRALDLLASAFGSENLIVRRFESSSWVNQSIYDDFLTSIGLDPSLPFIPLEEEVNHGLTDNAVEFQLLINRAGFLTPEEKHRFSSVTKKLSEESRKNGTYSRFSQEEISSLLARFEKGNEDVAEKYIKDGKPLFEEPKSDLPQWDANKSDREKETLQFFRALQEADASQEETIELLLVLIFQLYDEVESLKKFREKVRHPFRTCWNKIFHSGEKSGS